MPHDLRRFFERSFEALRREAPRFLDQLYAKLPDRRVGVRSGREEFCLTFQKHDVRVENAGPAEDVSLDIDRRTILALADGELTLEDALREDRLELYGSVERVAEFYDGLQIYIAGAVRCRDFPYLLTEFRASSHSQDQEVSYESTTAPR